MLQSPTMNVNGRLYSFHTSVRFTEEHSLSIEYWTAHLARDLLKLGAFLRAMHVMVQVPGTPNYRWLCHDDAVKDGPREVDDPKTKLKEVDVRTGLHILAECLQRVGAAGLIRQVPGGKDLGRIDLSPEWMAYIDRVATFRHGLLNLIAECLDQLIVEPRMAELTVAPEANWWQRWWRHME